MSQPEVFIIESLGFDDERAGRFEGQIVSKILALSDKKCEYCYIRTKREFKELLKQFESSSYRYLHLSCHGEPGAIHTTLDKIPFDELGPLIKPYLRKRRLFMSACSATNRALADSIMPRSGCYSILRPNQDIFFSDAAVLWSSFYHVMFNADSDAMKYKTIKAKAQEASDMYRVKLTLIGHDQDNSKGFTIKSIAPRKEPI